MKWEDFFVGTYEVKMTCNNCEHVAMMRVKKGLSISDAAKNGVKCPNCGLKEMQTGARFREIRKYE